MENTHLAFLTTLGGKLSGEGASGAKFSAKSESTDTDRDGFFAILNRLLTPGVNGVGEEAELLAPPAIGTEGETLEPEFPVALTTAPVDNINEEDGAALAGLLGAASGADAPVISIKADRAPVQTPTGATLNGAAALATSVAAGNVEDVSRNAELNLDASLDGESADQVLNLKSGLVKPGGLIETPSQILAKMRATPAVADNTIFAASGDGDAGTVERGTSLRLETASIAADKTVSVNPVRDQIVAAVVARQGEGRLEVRLDPPELGRVTINFDSDRGELVRAVISADTPETLDLMRRHADMFQRALAEQGFAGLDLQFAEQGARNAADNQDETGQAFVVSGDADLTSSDAHDDGPAAQMLALGRLDRRL